MRYDYKLLDYESYFSKWSGAFIDLTKKLVGESAGSVKSVPSFSPFLIDTNQISYNKSRLESDLADLRKMKRLRKKLLTFCEKNDVFKSTISLRYTLNYFDSDVQEDEEVNIDFQLLEYPVTIFHRFRAVNLILKKNIKNLEAKCTHKSINKKPRVDIRIALLLLQMIEFCKGDVTKINLFKKDLELKGRLHRMVLYEEEKEIARQLYNFEIYAKDIAAKKAKASEKMSVVILKTKRHLLKLKKQGIRWSFFSSRGSSENSNWINHLKQNLISTHLSKKSKRLVKKFDGLATEVAELNKRVIAKNQHLCFPDKFKNPDIVYVTEWKE